MSDDEEDDVRDDEELEALDQGALAPSAWRGKTVGQLLQQPRGMPVSGEGLVGEEITRILNLPRRDPVVEGSPTAIAMVELAMRKYGRAPGPGNCPCGCGFNCDCATIDPRIGTINPQTGRTQRRCVVRLKWQQAWALYEMSVVNGLVASAPVGLGKTALDILGALAFRNVEMALLMIPSNLRRQIFIDYQLIGEHFHVPNFRVHMPGRNMLKNEDVKYNKDGSIAPTVHVVPYGHISDEHNSQWIDSLKPELLLFDEFDSLADTTSSRTMRVMRFIEENASIVRAAGWTGSPFDNSIAEVAHVMAAILRKRSPLPTDITVVNQFSRCIDAVKNPCPPGALRRFLNPGEPDDVPTVRRALARRISGTAGCIILGGRNIVRTLAGDEVENNICEKPAPKLPERVLEALAKARNSFRPDSMVSDDEDEIMNDPLEIARVVRQIATGVFYRWKWNGVPRWLALDWLAKRRAWNAELSEKRLQGVPLLDSEKLCTDAAKRYWGDADRLPGLPEWRAENWPAWRDIKDQCNPKTEALLVDDFLIKDAAAWAAQNRGIIWYGMREFGARLAQETGLKVYGEGMKGSIENITGDEPVIMSIKSYGRGTNGLQFLYDKQLVINTLASARWFQQVLGRLCRDGQESNLVNMELYLHTRELRTTFEQAIDRGTFVEDMTDEEQMLIRGWRGYSTQLADRAPGP